jgi:Toc86/159 family protein import component
LGGKDIELFDYAALAELLRAANQPPGQGKAKVFPVENSDSMQPSPTVVSVPRTSVVADPESAMTDEEKKLYVKVDMARIKYLRLVHRLGYDTEHQVPIQVLYRLSLVEGFRRIRMANHSSELDNAWNRALQLEAEGIDNLEFSCNVLVLGKTGVGKSATINSIFGEDKSNTNAFLPATCSVKEIAGVVGGVKFRGIDTPGLGTTVKDEKSNRKVLKSVKKYMKKCPPDIVLYVDRIDTERQGANDLSLLRCITSVLGLSIWPKVIITLTHSAADPPEGPSGAPMNYEMAITHRTRVLQQSIRQTTNDPRIENPVALVENHHLCERTTEGEKVLPNGLIWRRLLLLLCYSLKMVAEIDSLSTRRAASASLFGLHLQMPALPYFLSSLLRSREHPRRASEQKLESVDSDVDIDELLDEDQEDEDYDQLPPFKPLSKSQVAKLSKEQQKLYFDEYDYRTKLLEKKQLKEQRRRLKEMKKSEGDNHDVPGNNDHPDDEYDNDRSLMPDWALPSSFDSDDPVYRYRCLEPTANLLVRAVTNPEGWDHDCGFDGVSLQYSHDVANAFPGSLWVQVNKDKREFTINLESSISAKHSEYASTLAGFDIQTMMGQLAYTLRGETKFKNTKKNSTTGGLSMTLVGNTMVTGAKFEDKLSVGNWLTLIANAGAVSMKGDTAYGVNMVANLLEKDYSMGQGLATLGASLVRWHKDWTMAANLDSQFTVGRTSSMAVHVDLNNKLTGRVSIKANSSEHPKAALLGIFSVAMYLWNRMHPCADPSYE